MHKGKRLSTPQLRTALANLEVIWSALYIHAVTGDVVQMASQVAREHALRAYDALHMASAMAFADKERMAVACWDRELRDASHGLGFALIPERI